MTLVGRNQSAINQISWDTQRLKIELTKSVFFLPANPVRETSEMNALNATPAIAAIELRRIRNAIACLSFNASARPRPQRAQSIPDASPGV